MNEPGPNTRRLIELASTEDEPSDEAAAAVGGKLMSALGLPFAGPSGGEGLPIAAPTAAPTVLGAVGSLPGVLAVSVAIGVAGAAVFFAQGEPESELTSTPNQASPVASPKDEEQRSVDEAQTLLKAEKKDGVVEEEAAPEGQKSGDSGDKAAPLKGVSRKHSPSARSGNGATRAGSFSLKSEAKGGTAASTAPQSELEEEARALRAAQRALRAGKTAQALQLLDSQERDFSAGQLSEERAAARAIAVCQNAKAEGLVSSQGKLRAEASGFAKHYPQSVLLSRVRSACSSD